MRMPSPDSYQVPAQFSARHAPAAPSVQLHVAALRGNAEAVELLLEAAPDAALLPDHDSGANR